LKSAHALFLAATHPLLVFQLSTHRSWCWGWVLKRWPHQRLMLN